MGAALDALDDVPDEWIRVSVDDVPIRLLRRRRSTRSSTSPTQLPAKVAALRAHATQVTVSTRRPGAARCRTTSRCPLGAIEHYVLVSGGAGARDDRGWETDLLAGLNLG